jgi:hypothetical protein
MCLDGLRRVFFFFFRNFSALPFKDRFPFKEFFSDSPRPVFTGQSFEKDMEEAIKQILDSPMNTS